MRYSHLRVKYTRIRFHNANSLIESLQCIGQAFLIRNNSRQIKLQILRLQFRRKAVANALALTARNFNVVSRGSEITDNCRSLASEISRPKVAADEDDGDGLWLFIADGEESLGWVAINELDTEDFGGRKRGGSFHREIGRGRRLLCFCFFSLGDCQSDVDRWPFGGFTSWATALKA